MNDCTFFTDSGQIIMIVSFEMSSCVAYSMKLCELKDCSHDAL